MNNLLIPNLPIKSHMHKSQCKNKFDFKTAKRNTICSLNEVECFLNNFHKLHIGNYLKAF